MRVGWSNGPNELIAHCENLGLAMLYGLPGFIQDAALTALTDARGEVEKMLEITASAATWLQMRLPE